MGLLNHGPHIWVCLGIGDIFGRETLTLKPEPASPKPPVNTMFGRRKKDKEVVGTPCPFCGFVNELGAQQCTQCYYEFDRAARDQPTAPPTTSNNDIMAMLLGDNEEDDEEAVMVEAVLALDDVTVEVDQYAAVAPSATGEENEDVATFDYIESATPALTTTVVSRPEDENDVESELTSNDAPKASVEFEVPDVDPLKEVSEPVHTGQGGLFTAEGLPDETNEDMTGSVGPDPSEEMALPDLPEDDDVLEQPSSLAAAVAMEEEVVAMELPEVPDVPDWPDENELAAATPVIEVPDIPDLPLDDDHVATPALPEEQNPIEPSPAPEVPDLPDDSTPALPEDTPVLSEDTLALPEDTPAIPEDTPALPDDTPALPDMEEGLDLQPPVVEPTVSLRMWPWPADEPWSNQQVYQAVIAAMEHVKHGRLPTAAAALDELGPHLDHHLDMLPHIIAIMVHIGRKEHAEWTVQMAAHLFGDDPHVQQARAQVPE